MKLPIDYENSHWTVRKKAREQYIKEQDGKCWFCDNPLKGDPASPVDEAVINMRLFPRGMFDYPIHLHHDRVTGYSLGAVHAKCNAYMWQYYGE